MLIDCSNITNAQLLGVSVQLQGTRTPVIITEGQESADFWRVCVNVLLLFVCACVLVCLSASVSVCEVEQVYVIITEGQESADLWRVCVNVLYFFYLF